jgi:hypothetical protein
LACRGQILVPSPDLTRLRMGLRGMSTKQTTKRRNIA